jgi:hypothetical protein
MILVPILAVTGAVAIIHHFWLRQTVIQPLKARVAALEKKT